MGRRASDNSEGKERSDAFEKRMISDGSEGSEASEGNESTFLQLNPYDNPVHQPSPLQVFNF